MRKFEVKRNLGKNTLEGVLKLVFEPGSFTNMAEYIIQEMKKEEKEKTEKTYSKIKLKVQQYFVKSAMWGFDIGKYIIMYKIYNGDFS